MHFAQSTGSSPRRAGTLAAIALAACFSASAADRPPAREQIQFSSPRESVDLNPKDESQSKQFEFLDRNNSVSGAVAPYQAPPAGPPQNNFRNTRLLFEAYDRKKNWIYGPSGSLERLAVTDTAFGRADFGASSGKPRMALESFLGDSDRPSRNRARDAVGDRPRLDSQMDFGPVVDRDSRMESEARSRLNGSLDPMRTVTAGFSLPGDFFAPSRGREPLSNIQNPGPIEPLSNPYGGPNTVGKLLAVPGSINPLVPGFNPLNLVAGAPGQESSPASMQRPAELPVPGTDVFNARRLADPTVNHSSTLLADPSARLLTPSSLSPAVAAPSETLYVQPRPTVLEIPRRKF